ncbi:hypothetical protein [Actinophytocola oryzae]|uniref:hypothetical protein n=1 Tax=Actinophytocola oryzae TaxID=502181 RepID=UPI001414E29A|nr:hypothetical protein [Actinophytocola oryzae]
MPLHTATFANNTLAVPSARARSNTVAAANTPMGRQPASRGDDGRNSRPMLTNATIRDQVRRSFATAMVSLASAAPTESTRTVAAMKPSTSVGNRCHSSIVFGRGAPLHPAGEVGGRPTPLRRNR